MKSLGKGQKRDSRPEGAFIIHNSAFILIFVPGIESRESPEPSNSHGTKTPLEAPRQGPKLRSMNPLLLILVLVLLFGGGGFYLGGPAIGGGGIGLILMVALIIYFVGGFRTKS